MLAENDELEIMRLEAVVMYFMALSNNLMMLRKTTKRLGIAYIRTEIRTRTATASLLPVSSLNLSVL